MKNMIHSWKRKSAQYRELKKQKGVTLLEIIIVLGIIGIIAAGVVILAQRAFTSQDISDLTDNTNSVRVAMTEAYKDSAEYPARADSNSETKAGIETSPEHPQSLVWSRWVKSVLAKRSMDSLTMLLKLDLQNFPLLPRRIKLSLW